MSLLVYQSQVYIHCPTQNFALQSYITWQLVLALNVGHHQASRTQKCVQKLYVNHMASVE